MPRKSSTPPDDDEDILSALMRCLYHEFDLEIETLMRIEKKLRLQYGGKRYYLPKRGVVRETALWRRNELICGALDKGESTHKIARRLRISPRQVQRIYSRHKAMETAR